MKRIHVTGVLAGGTLALFACGEPSVAPQAQAAAVSAHASLYLAPPTGKKPKADPPIDPDATSVVDEAEGKKQAPGQLKPKQRNNKGEVAGAPPPPAAAAVGGQSRTYTLDADFDEGGYSNVVRVPGNQLQLDNTTTPFNFMWVAVSSKGTIVKINTETGQIIGEYRSAPAGHPHNPSRTTVDKSGNVWAGNRSNSTVVHIGLVENHQCVDRNGNGRIDTSTGLGDVLDWTNTGGGVSTATDECIIHYTTVSSSGVRHVSVTADNNVWVSGTGGRRFELIDGSTGAVIRNAGSINYGGYGGLIDGAGVIWSARPLLRWDTSKPLDAANTTRYNHDSYGLCIDSQGNVWNTSLGGSRIYKFGPDGTQLGIYQHGSPYAQGCVVDRNDHVWVAHSALGGQTTVGHLLPDGTHLGNVTVGNGPTGVSVDARGKIWAANYHSRTVSRIDPSAGATGSDGATKVGAVDFTTVDLGGLPYNYSDMTGSTLFGAPNNGSWTVIHDSSNAATNWGKVSWNSQVTGNGFLRVTVESSEDAVNWSAPVEAQNGVDFNVADGRFLRVSVAFGRANDGTSPILYDLTVAVGNEAPDCSKASPSVASLWPPKHQFEPVTITGVTDPDGDSVAIKITSIRQDEPVDDKGDGKHVPDGTGVGTATAEVRAERSGTIVKKGNGRVYHIGFTATDSNGASCSGVVQVGVPHDKNDKAVDDGPTYDSTRTH
jgi:hypothetical protein